MEAVLSRLKVLSDDELREEFARAGVKCGPITATTRSTFERKLARVLAEAEPGGRPTEQENCSSSGAPCSATSVSDDATPKSAAAAVQGSNSGETDSEECDFGYGIGLNPPEEDQISATTSSISSAEIGNSQYRPGTPSKPAQASPALYYGVCPQWDDVLGRTGKTGVKTSQTNRRTDEPPLIVHFSFRESTCVCR